MYGDTNDGAVFEDTLEFACDEVNFLVPCKRTIGYVHYKKVSDPHQQTSIGLYRALHSCTALQILQRGTY